MHLKASGTSGRGIPVEVSQRIVDPGVSRDNDSIHNEEDGED